MLYNFLSAFSVGFGSTGVVAFSFPANASDGKPPGIITGGGPLAPALGFPAPPADFAFTFFAPPPPLLFPPAFFAELAVYSL